MSGIYFWITVLFIVQLFTQNTFAQDLSATGFFNRCYTQLTGKPVPLNHALMSKVKSGDISAIDACIQILHKGQLTTSGPLTTPGDPESRAVLNNFYTFHRTWFATNNVNSIQGYSAGEQNGTGDVFDASEPALSVTYSLFFPGQKYSDTLTRATGVHAIRSEDNTIAARMKWKSAFPGRYLIDDPMMANSVFSFRATATTPTEVNRNINKHISSKLNVPNIEVGNLIGIRATIESLVVPNLSLSPLGNTNTDKGSLYADKLNYSYDLYKNLGGGILGSPIYILENLGHGFDMKFNGQTKVARRWSQANMNSFLCANLPSLREMDVQKFVDPTSSAPFRNGTSCVMCHATLDQMAYTLRNVTVGATDYFLPNLDGDVTIDASGKQVNPPRANVRTSISITTYKSLNESVTGWPTEPVTDFHLQKPTGRLYFRSLTGTLIDKPLNGVADLGQALSDTDDYYLCAAKRYFEFMTGIQVPLYDRTDPKNADLNKNLTATAIDDRKFIETLAANLRSSGSIMLMIEDIIKSNYYKKENYR